MTRQEFFDKVNRHDWFYEYSDDHRVWREGSNSFDTIRNAMKENAEFRAIYDEFTAYYNKERETRPTLQEFDYEV